MARLIHSHVIHPLCQRVSTCQLCSNDKCIQYENGTSHALFYKNDFSYNQACVRSPQYMKFLWKNLKRKWEGKRLQRWSVFPSELLKGIVLGIHCHATNYPKRVGL